jgi:hypothetical protein
MLPSAPADLAALLDLQRTLEAQLRRLPDRAQNTLLVGRAVLEFAERESEASSVLEALLDPAAYQDLEREHGEIAGDLALLEWLVSSGENPQDVPVLSRSLMRRMRDHVERDGRLLLRGLRLSRA